jgi:predicted aminopeptidase
VRQFLIGARIAASLCLFVAFVFLAWHYRMIIYLARQGMGQARVIQRSQPISRFLSTTRLSPQHKKNLLLVGELKKFSVDSFGFYPTSNFTTVYNEGDRPTLWAITACAPYALKAYEWTFPLIGTVTYKGFFDSALAISEYNHLVSSGFDVDLRPVSAWSTLGWFSDPILSNTLKKKKGALCNLIFHELFHATYYAPGNVDLNENLASFVAHKATIKFLQNDSLSLMAYLDDCADDQLFRRFIKQTSEALPLFYEKISGAPSRYILKMKYFVDLVKGIDRLPLRHRQRTAARKREILKSKNAYFVDYEQYEGLQDSLEKVFNKIYNGDLKKLVQSLKRN